VSAIVGTEQSLLALGLLAAIPSLAAVITVIVQPSGNGDTE